MNNWISVKDQLPASQYDYGEYVLAWDVAGYDVLFWWELVQNTDVTHWQPLPEPPKE